MRKYTLWIALAVGAFVGAAFAAPDAGTHPHGPWIGHADAGSTHSGVLSRMRGPCAGGSKPPCP